MTEVERLREVVATLRSDHGCPWDRKQTHASLKTTCIEEAAEVVCGINILEATGNADNLKEELGDLLLQVVFQAQMAEEEGLFDLEDVARASCEKMIRRHPHIFGAGAEASHGAPAEAAGSDGSASNAGAASDAVDAPASECSAVNEDAASDAIRQAAADMTAGAAGSMENYVQAWEEIKKSEKAGHEWEAAYLPAAMEEAIELIRVAQRRKGFIPEEETKPTA